MKYVCPLLAVSDLEASKKFYQEIFDQEITMDLGANVSFSGGFTIQFSFPELLGLDPDSMVRKSHNFELYFEEEDFDTFMKRLINYDVEYVHQPKQYPWQQLLPLIRLSRLYAYPDHIS